MSLTTTEFIFILLVIYQLKQFLADFPLQGKYMLKKVVPGWDFVLPMVSHCGMHAALTLMIVLYGNSSLWYLALVDFCVHFITDRVKSGPSYLGRFKDKSRASYWNVFGLDQMIHHLTHLYIIWVIVNNTSMS
jgi:hypothetical protein